MPKKTEFISDTHSAEGKILPMQGVMFYGRWEKKRHHIYSSQTDGTGAQPRNPQEGGHSVILFRIPYFGSSCFLKGFSRTCPGTQAQPEV